MPSLLSLDTKAAGNPFGLTNYNKLKDDIDLLIRSSDGILSPGRYKLWDSVDAGVSLPAATITTPALPQTFKHLEIEIAARGDAVATSVSLKARFNSDSSGDYNYEQLQATNTTVAAAGTQHDTSALLGFIAAASAPSNAQGIIVAKIPNYAASAPMKQWATMLNYFETADTAAGQNVQSIGGAWLLTGGGVSTIAFLLSSGNFVAGTRITIYGEA